MALLDRVIRIIWAKPAGQHHAADVAPSTVAVAIAPDPRQGPWDDRGDYPTQSYDRGSMVPLHDSDMFPAVRAPRYAYPDPNE